jgi:hypothetical protein
LTTNGSRHLKVNNFDDLDNNIFPLLIGKNIYSLNKMQHIHCNNNDQPPKKCVEFDLEFDCLTVRLTSSLNNPQIVK